MMRKACQSLVFILLLTSGLPSFGQWQWLNPQPTGNPIRDITFVTGQKGFLITNSQLSVTVDNGLHWTTTQHLTGGNKINFRNETGFIVGDGGAVYRSKNFGDTWEQLTVDATQNFISVYVAGSDSISIISSYNIYKTSDGGNTWKKTVILPATGGKLISSVCFRSSKIIQAGTTSGKLLKSIDGGKSWYITYEFPYDLSWQTINFRDALNGLAASDGAGLYQTTDGGESWEIYQPLYARSRAIVFPGDSIFYIAGESGSIFKWIDNYRWANIMPVPANNGPDAINVLYFQSELIGYAAGANGWLFKTTDAGEHWIQYATTFEDISAVSFSGPSKGYAFGNGVYKTTDTGITWTQANNGITPRNYYAYTGYFPAADTGFVFQYNEFASVFTYKTTDGGTTWMPKNFPSYRISFVTKEIGYAAAPDGIYQTLDAGDTWQQQSAFVASKIDFTDAQNGMAFGDDGIYTTADDGVSWTLVLPLSPPATAMDMVSKTTAFVLIPGNSVLRTDDGGKSWQKYDLPFLNNIQFQAIKFYSENVGYCAPNGDRIFATDDGGNSWQPLDDPHPFLSLSITGNTLFASGMNGMVVERPITYRDNVISATRADSVTSTSALLTGFVAANRAPLEGITIVYGSAGDPGHTVVLPETVAKGTHASFSSKVVGLRSGEHYSFHFAATQNGTSFSANEIQFDTSPVTGLPTSPEESITIYPNPSATRAKVVSPIVMDEVIVLNSFGQIVVPATQQAKVVEINAENLSLGVYFIKVVRQNRVSVLRFVRN